MVVRWNCVIDYWFICYTGWRWWGWISNAGPVGLVVQVEVGQVVLTLTATSLERNTGGGGGGGGKVVQIMAEQAALVLSSSKSPIRIAQYFHGGVTRLLLLSGGYNIYSVTATSTTNETVTLT
jgi:hypothetical protein